MLISTNTNRAKPTKTGDGSNSIGRGTRYGELLVVPLTEGTYALSDEGSYFKVTNPTPGTGIAAAITTAFSATAAFFNIRNNSAVGGNNRRLYMDYMNLICVTAPASATSVQLAITLDSPATARYSSAGSLLTAVNANMDDATTSESVIHAGALVLTAASGSARLVSRGVLKGAIPVIQDNLMLNFGKAANVSQTMTGGPLGTTDDVGPLIIGPQMDLNIHLWFPANATTAGVWELECGFWER